MYISACIAESHLDYAQMSLTLPIAAEIIESASWE